MLEATTDRPAPSYRAFKFRLDPTAAQRQDMARSAGAARVAYNMLVSYNTKRDKAYEARRAELLVGGMTPVQATAQLKEERKTNPDLVVIGAFAYDTQHLTPERTRHKDAAAALARGETLETVWSDPRYDTPWMHTTSRRVLTSGLRNAGQAWSNYFASKTGERAGPTMRRPKLKKKGRHRDSFTIPAPEKMGAYDAHYKRGEARSGIIGDYKHLRLGFLGVIRVHGSTKRLTRALRRGEIVKSFTISRSADYWYASMLVEQPVTAPASPTRTQAMAPPIGVDLGITHLATFSDGRQIANPRHLKRSQVKRTKLQRAIARGVKGSGRRKKLQQRLARLEHRIALQRRSTAHRLTKALAIGYPLIAIEDLHVAGMARSARGTVLSPGKNVKAKSGLNSAILDVGWGEIRRQLEYKTRWYGSRLEVIGRFEASSKTCSGCGAVKSTLSLSERIYQCAVCGRSLDRDHNAALNILLIAARGDLTDQYSPPEGGEDKRTPKLLRVAPAGPELRGGVVDASRAISPIGSA